MVEMTPLKSDKSLGVINFYIFQRETIFMILVEYQMKYASVSHL